MLPPMLLLLLLRLLLLQVLLLLLLLLPCPGFPFSSHMHTHQNYRSLHPQTERTIPAKYVKSLREWEGDR